MGKCNVILGFVARAAVVGSLVATVSAPAVVGASSSRGLSHSTRAVPAAAPDATQLSGTVTNTDGQPIDGLEILLVGSDAHGSNSAGFSDEDGDFSVPAVAGDYSVYFIDSSGTYIYGCYVGPTVPGQFAAQFLFNVNCAQATLSPGETFEINATIPRVRHIEGLVTGAGGDPVSGVSIDALNADGTMQNRAYSGVDGSFSLTVPEGSYQVLAYDIDLYAGGCYAGEGDVSIDDTGCLMLDLAESDATGINLTLPNRDMTGLHVISGTVSGPDGSGLPNISVSALEAWEGTWAAFAETDASGFYSLAVPSGYYYVEVNDSAPTYVGGCYTNDPTVAGNLSTDFACAGVYVGSDAPDATGIDMTMPLGGQTPTGTDVTVTPLQSGAPPVLADWPRISFSQVDSSGTTSVATSPSGPAPSGFSLGLNPTYYDFSTDAAHTGPVTVCLAFDPAAYSNASLVRLYHYDGGAWKDVTTFTSYTPIPWICGVAASLSPFAIGQAPAPHALKVAVGLNPFPAGTHSVTVKALDAYGNVATAYTGTIHFTSSDPKAILPADYTFTTADKGVHVFANTLRPGLTLKTAGSKSLTATDVSYSSIKGSQTVTVSPGAVRTLKVSAAMNPWPAGSTHSFTVTALDAYGNIATGYTGTIGFTTSDTKASVPADYTFTAADKGAHAFSNTLKPGLRLNTVGSQWVRATDKKTSSITGVLTVSVKQGAVGQYHAGPLDAIVP